MCVPSCMCQCDSGCVCRGSAQKKYQPLGPALAVALYPVDPGWTSDSLGTLKSSHDPEQHAHVPLAHITVWLSRDQGLTAAFSQKHAQSLHSPLQRVCTVRHNIDVENTQVIVREEKRMKGNVKYCGSTVRHVYLLTLWWSNFWLELSDVSCYILLMYFVVL